MSRRTSRFAATPVIVLSLVLALVALPSQAAALDLKVLAPPPLAPSHLTGAAVAQDEIALEWRDNSTNETTFKIERKKLGGVFIEIAAVGANVTEYVDKGLQPGQTYIYRVKAVNVATSSPYSNEATVVLILLPAAPAFLAAKAVSENTVLLSWNDNSSTETGFVVERKRQGGSYARVGTAPAGATAFTDGPIGIAGTYTYRVKAFNNQGESGYSNEASVAVVGMALPTAPRSLAVMSTLSSTSVVLAWEDRSDNEERFEVERRTATGQYGLVGTTLADATGCGNGPLGPGVYYFRVRAANAAGTSAYSNEAAITLTGVAVPVIFVKADATGANDGTSWQNAYTDLDDALEGAIQGDEIWIAAGTYRPTSTHSAVTDPRYRHFRLKNGVAVLGGFRGNEVSRIQRDWVANETVLSGDIGVPGDDQDNCYHVFMNLTKGLERTTVLDGVTISGGRAIGTYNYYTGAGMLNDTSSMTLRNVIFRDNRALQEGGGIFNSGGSPLLENVTFVRNRAGQSGGGIYNTDSNIELRNVSFYANYGGQGGAMYTTASAAILVNTVFSCNRSIEGGALYLAGHDIETLGSPVVVNATITNNHAMYGGGVQTSGSSPQLISCIVWGNSAQINGNQIWSFGEGTPTASHSAVSGGWPGEGNIALHPQFSVNPAFGDDDWATDDDNYGRLSLQDTSPCINQGDNVPFLAGGVAEGLASDAAGYDRMVGPAVDMGAHEGQYTTGGLAMALGFRPVELPARPGSLAGMSTEPMGAQLVWADGSSNEEAFIVERRTAGTQYQRIALLSANQGTSQTIGASLVVGAVSDASGIGTLFGGLDAGLAGVGFSSFEDTGLVGGNTYYYRVKSRNANGDSPYTGEIQVVTPTTSSSSTEVRLYVGRQDCTVNGQMRQMDVAPEIVESRTLLPVRYVAEPLGAVVLWDGGQQKVTLVRGKRVIELWIGKSAARVNGVEVPIDPDNSKVMPLIMPPGRTMLPVRFITESLDCEVMWTEATREVRILYAAP